MSGFILNELLEKLNKRDKNDTRFGSSLELRVATADAKKRTVTYEYEVGEDELYRGYLDSGWLSTVVDNATDPLIRAVANNDNTVTTSLTVNTLEPTLRGTLLEIICRLVQFEGRMLQATVTFRDARKKNIVYATGMHTVVYRDNVGAKLPMCAQTATECDFRDHVSKLAQAKQSHYYYSACLESHVVSADRKQRQMTVEIAVGDGEISSAGCMDEGLVATVADYWTSTLISAVNDNKGSVTTSLTVQGLRPIVAGTLVHIICEAANTPDGSMPCATAKFVNAADYRHVYAVVSHTKYFIQPKSRD
ncbi:hypothetical protein GGI07_001709 [Coemansia sp. Benny D115]|nr:hypothetical protein GGI07_001709 [Coemansia sp. Benny D115]